MAPVRSGDPVHGPRRDGRPRLGRGADRVRIRGLPRYASFKAVCADGLPNCGFLIAARLRRRAGELPLQGVSGKVTLDNRPLDRGQIIFSPEAGGVGTQAGGSIEEGSYSIPQSQGLMPGKYSVMITAGSAAEGDPDDPAKKVKAVPDPVPSQYNARTTLKAEIAPQGPNTFDYALKSK